MDANEQQRLLKRIGELREDFKNENDEIMKKIIISRGRALRLAYEMIHAKEIKSQKNEINDQVINELFGGEGEALT